MTSSTAAVIGAGPSGLAGLKELLRCGVDASCFEAANTIAPRWCSDKSGVISPVYDSLRLNNASRRMRFSERPLARHHGRFATAREFHDYLAMVAEELDLRRAISLQRTVEQLDLVDGVWRLTFADPSFHDCQHVIFATGLNGAPAIPSGLKAFEGQLVHATDYQRPAAFAGERVLVVGAGNSGAEIACEIASVAATVDLSFPRPVHLVPREMFGFECDRLDGPHTSRLPLALRQAMHDIALFRHRNRARKAGIRIPSDALLRSAWTISSDLAASVGRKEVSPVGATVSCDGHEVAFHDGERRQYDAVILATGYTPTFPRLPYVAPITRTTNDCYLKIVPLPRIGAPRTWYLGFLLPLGALLPVAEAQGRWIAACVSGRISLPASEIMAAVVYTDGMTERTRFSGTAAPTMLADPYPYIRRLDRQVRKARLTGSLAAAKD